MNPRDLVDVLRTMRDKAHIRAPWVGGPSANHIALRIRRERFERQDWFPVSPALYETVKELYDKLEKCFSALLNYEARCRKHGIEGER